MSDAEDRVANALAALWLRNRALVEERLALLDRVAEAAEAGTLDDALRTEGIGNAHKLAGSLGMYGYDEGTRIAREMEMLLGGGSSDGVRLRELCVELRAAVFPAA
jgi:HPt (histidine-containing phosphotransfer) domain-containing protein